MNNIFLLNSCTVSMAISTICHCGAFKKQSIIILRETNDKRGNLNAVSLLIIKGTGKAILVTGREGPQGCEMLRLPHFLESAYNTYIK
jgi:hypothetical protein